MRKIMLVIDDFNELVGFETFFRRIGFDVLSLGKDILVGDAILGFVPDLVIATAKGRSVDGMRLAMKLKRQATSPRTALIYSSGQNIVLAPETQAVVDAMIEIPAQPRAVLRIVSQLVGLEAESLIDKFDKLDLAKANLSETKRIFSEVKGGAKESEDFAVATGGSGPSLEWDPVKTPGFAARARSPRSDRYEKFLADHEEDVGGTIPRQRMAAASKRLKEDSAGEKAALDQIDEAKRQFAKTLFEEGKDSGES